MKEVIVSSAFNKRLISRLMSSRPVDSSNTNFVLKGSKDFTARSKDVFGELKPLENAHQTWVTENKTHDTFQNSDDLDTPEFDRPVLKSVCKASTGSSSKTRSPDVLNPVHDSTAHTSLFKKPQFTRVHRQRSNFVPNSSKKRKWTKYSLEDVPLSSDAANTSIALGFIDMLRKRKASEEDVDDNKGGKIMFSKPQQKSHSKMSCSTPRKDLLTKSEKKDKTECCSVKLDHLENESD